MSIESSSPSRATQRIAGQHVRVLESPVLVNHAGHASGEAHGGLSVAPYVEDGRIARIEIRCACGQSVTLECVYDDDASAAGVSGEGGEPS